MLQFKSLFGIVSIFFILLSVACNPDEIEEVSSLPSNHIHKITIDAQGVKWIATDKGLVSYNNDDWEIYTKALVLNDKTVNDLALCFTGEKQYLWLATMKGLAKGISSAESFTLTQSYLSIPNELLNDTVYKVATDINNVAYFGTKSGISVLKENTWTAYRGEWGKKKDTFLASNQITGIATSKNGWNYVSTKGGGVSRFKYTDGISGATKFFQPWAYGLKSDTILTVIVVNDSCQWYGTDRGVAYHTSHNTKADWTTYTREDGLCSDTVYAIAQDVKSIVWFGTHTGLSKFSDGNWTNYTVKDGLVANKINTVAIDLDGSVWIGTDNGISHFKNNSWKSFQMK